MSRLISDQPLRCARRPADTSPRRVPDGRVWFVATAALSCVSCGWPNGHRGVHWAVREAPLRTGTLAGAEPCPILSGSLDALWEARERGSRDLDALPRQGTLLGPRIAGRDRSSVAPATILSPSRRQHQGNGRRLRYGERPSAEAHREAFPSHPLTSSCWLALPPDHVPRGRRTESRARGVDLSRRRERGNTVTRANALERRHHRNLVR